MSFAEACGAADAARAAASEAVLRRLGGEGIDLVRIGWCDSHGILRGKTLAAAAVPRALADGIGLVSTILLKDTSDRTAYRVFEPGATSGLPGFGFANNLVLLPDPASFIVLPWAPGTGWMRAEAWFDDATPVPIDTRFILRQALDRLAEKGFGLTCGLEVEFHIYRLADPLRDAASLDPERAAWPGEPPAMTMIHPGYNLLSKAGPIAATRRCASSSAPPRAWGCRSPRSRSSSGRARSRRCSRRAMRSPPPTGWSPSATA